MQNIKEKIKNIINKEIYYISNIPVNDNFNNAIKLIYQCVHLDNGKVVCSGMGKAGQIALNIATTFSSTGTCAVFLHPGEAQHGDLGILKENDILLLLSNSGKTREVLELIELSKRLCPKIKIITITGNIHSPISKLSDVTLHTGKTEEVCPLGLTPTTSTTLMTIIGDILVVLMMEKINFTKEQYSLRHHAGYNGAISRGDGIIY